MNDYRLRIATRGSQLALAQTELVIQRLRAIEPAIQPQIIPITTRGDQHADAPLWKMPGSGFFTAQVEQALLEGHADWAVHSLKDLPSAIRPELTIAAMLPRANPADVLVSREPMGALTDLPQPFVVGTSSPRRMALLASRYPNVSVRALRGNVPTRLEKLRRGEYDAILVAAAGLERLGIQDEFHFLELDPTVFVPAAGQGIIAVQSRADDSQARELAAGLNDPVTALCARAERAVVASLHPGCHTPLGVFAQVSGDLLTVYAFAAPLSGWPAIHRYVTGACGQALAIAVQLVDELKRGGIENVLNAFQEQQND